jgi:hypothetical protein
MASTSTSSPKAWSRISRSYADIYQHYRFHCKDEYTRELRWFAEQRSLRLAVARAAVARSPSGSRLLHQRRAPRCSLYLAHKTLTANLGTIATCQSFDALMCTIKNLLAHVRNLRDVYIYDTALRIAAHLSRAGSHLPTTVYLHQGSLVGARKIASVAPLVPASSPSVAAACFPHPISKLPPYEIENLLCIYRHCLH